jgi:hypothetical protein
MNNPAHPAKTKPILPRLSQRRLGSRFISKNRFERGTPAPRKADCPFKAEKQANCKKIEKIAKIANFFLESACKSLLAGYNNK